MIQDSVRQSRNIPDVGKSSNNTSSWERGHLSTHSIKLSNPMQIKHSSYFVIFVNISYCLSGVLALCLFYHCFSVWRPVYYWYTRILGDVSVIPLHFFLITWTVSPLIFFIFMKHHMFMLDYSRIQVTCKPLHCLD
jgi:hypothetical protein